MKRRLSTDAALALLEIACEQLARTLLKKPTVKAVRQLAIRIQRAALLEATQRPSGQTTDPVSETTT